MTTKLRLYNRALRYCKERKLASLTESREPRRLLDDVYDDGGIDTCLEEAMWKFASRTVKLDYDASQTVEFGYNYAFSKPTDWKKTVALCSDEYFRNPLLDYHHEAGFWYADLEEIYVRYVSNDADYGYSLGDWPDTFSEYVAAHFAKEIVGKLVGSNKAIIEEVERLYDQKKKIAKSNDAWNQPQKFPAPGNWSQSRNGVRGNRRDFGNTGSLLG